MFMRDLAASGCDSKMGVSGTEPRSQDICYLVLPLMVLLLMVLLLMMLDSNIKRSAIAGGSDTSSSCHSMSRPSSPSESISPSLPVTPASSFGTGSPRASCITSCLPDSGEAKVLPPISSPQDEYLQFLEPNPVYPPEYDSLPPGGCPKYQVLSKLPNDCNIPNVEQEQLPQYDPSVYKIGVVSRKIEWLTPYEAAPSRLWKYLIMELNSTQLNFYQIPTNLENHILAFRPTPLNNERNFNKSESIEVDKYNSYLTSDDDLQFLKFCQRLGLLNCPVTSLNHNQGYDDEFYHSLVNNNNPTPITSKSHHRYIKQNKHNHKKLLRSYSLQHSRIGLATDYKKRANVLRLRIESEQLLLNFSTTRDLIYWNMALNTGKDISLDLNDREAPRYRTVPRRRRSNHNSSSSQEISFYQEAFGTSNSSLINLTNDFVSRSRAQSDPYRYNEPNKLKNKLSKLKTKLNSSSRSNSNINFSNVKFMTDITIQQYQNNNTNHLEIQNQIEIERKRAATLPTTPSFSITGYNSDGDDNDDNDNDDDEQNDPNESTRTSHDDDEDDIQNLSDLHRSDDEDDDEDEEVEIDVDDDIDNLVPIASHRRYISRCSYSSSSEYKWHPPADKPPLQRRFYRNCLRCIKPLNSQDPWVTRALVKPTTVSPLNLSYLKNSKYCPNQSNSNSLTNLSDANNSNTSLASLVSNNSSIRKKNIFSLPDASLSRIPNHYLKKYTVGTHGLIPTTI